MTTPRSCIQAGDSRLAAHGRLRAPDSSLVIQREGRSVAWLRSVRDVEQIPALFSVVPHRQRRPQGRARIRAGKLPARFSDRRYARPVLAIGAGPMAEPHANPNRVVDHLRREQVIGAGHLHDATPLESKANSFGPRRAGRAYWRRVLGDEHQSQRIGRGKRKSRGSSSDDHSDAKRHAGSIARERASYRSRPPATCGTQDTEESTREAP